MTMNYSPMLPRDKGGEAKQSYPPARDGLKSWGVVPTVSSIAILSDNTTELEIGAVGGAGVAFRWVNATDTQGSVISSGATANFDHIVPTGTVRRFVLPIDTTKVAPIGSIVGINVQMGLVSRIAWIQAGSAATASCSVFGVEY